MDTIVSTAPKVTVLMPVYNCELYIKEAVDSILNQTFSDFEFLIIDDASTDKTVDIIKTYSDIRIKLIEKSVNTGLTNSLNYGLTIAKGKYIARMDGDDISLPERFEKQISFLEANPDVVVCGTTFKILGTGELVFVPEIHDDIKIGLLQECKLGHPTVMFRYSTLIDHRITYDNLMEPVEDYDLWVRLSAIGKLHNLQECLLYYRVHDYQVSKVRNNKQIELAKTIPFKLLMLLDNTITSRQKEIYLKVIDKNENLTYQEFLVFLQLKLQLEKKNRNQFFNSDAFKRYWFPFESKFNGYYFKNRTTYSILVLKQYLHVFNKLVDRLNYKETVKLFIKSLIHYRVK